MRARYMGRFGSGLLLILGGFFLLVAAASADTLEMKDGRLIQGKFVGGSEYNIRFVVNGQEQIFATKDVLNISFNQTTAASPNNSANAPASGPNSQPNAYAAQSTPASPPAQSGQTVTVPSGTAIRVRMIDGIDSSKNKVGDQFQASLEDPIVVGDTVVAPKNADVYGRLAQAKEAGHISGASELRLELTGIRINGTTQPITTGDYQVAGKSRGKQSAERIGGGAALGAIIGAIAGGGKGAAVGAGVGAGAGTAVQVVTHGDQVRVPSETLLSFTLSQPMTVSANK